MSSTINVGNAPDPSEADAQKAHEAAMVEKSKGVKFSHSDDRTGVHFSNHGDEPKGDEPKGDEPKGDEPKAPQRPDHIPEKFWNAETGEVNVEALLKSQQELEKQFTKSRQEAPKGDEPKGDEPKADGEPTAQDNAVAKAREEFATKGELSEETYAGLEKAGLDRETVDAYIEGQRGKVTALQNAAYEQTGGEEGFKAMADWARGELSEVEIAAIDTLLGSTDPKVVAEGARQLADRYNNNAPREPERTIHGARPSSEGSHYRSRAEMTKDMSSKRYADDAGFREEVARKVAASSRAGIDLFA